MTKIAVWTSSLEHITEEISELWLDRLIWRSLRDMVQSIPTARDSFILAWIGEQYYRRAAIAVRTMADLDSRSDSLVNLLADMVRNPTEVVCPPALYSMRASRLRTVDPALVQADIDVLTAAAKPVGQYVNKHLAHIDRSAKVSIPALADVDDAVQLLGDLLEKYTLLLRNVDLKVEPVLGFDWAAGLREPWLSPTIDRSQLPEAFKA